MITRLHNLTTATAVFPTHELPDEVQQPVLQGLVSPRVISSSMQPTLAIGDRLDLAPADRLQVGDLVVFRQGSLLICHRVARMEDQRLYTKGDACDGPPEPISLSDVVGRVPAVLRGNMRLSVSPPSVHLRQGAVTESPLDRVADWGREQMGSLLRRLIGYSAGLPLIGEGIRLLFTHIVAVDVLEQAPLRSLTSWLQRDTVRLSRIGQLHEYLAATPVDLARVRLAIRIGPFLLGTCSLCPWSIQIRPAAVPLCLETSFQSLRRISETGNTP